MFLLGLASVHILRPHPGSAAVACRRHGRFREEEQLASVTLGFGEPSAPVSPATQPRLARPAWTSR